jgi:anti-anti-sigma factor
MVARWHVPPLSVRCHWNGRAATVIVCGDVDFATVSILSQRLSQVAARKPDRLVIDLSEARFIDAACVRALTRTRHALPGHCALVLRSPPRQVRRVLEVSGLDSLCTIEAEVHEGADAGRVQAQHRAYVPNGRQQQHVMWLSECWRGGLAVAGQRRVPRPVCRAGAPCGSRCAEFGQANWRRRPALMQISRCRLRSVFCRSAGPASSRLGPDGGSR